MQNPNVLDVFLNEFHPIIHRFNIFQLINKHNVSSSRGMIRLDNPNIAEPVLIKIRDSLQTFFMIN